MLRIFAVVPIERKEAVSSVETAPPLLFAGTFLVAASARPRGTGALSHCELLRLLMASLSAIGPMQRCPDAHAAALALTAGSSVISPKERSGGAQPPS